MPEFRFALKPAVYAILSLVILSLLWLWYGATAWQWVRQGYACISDREKVAAFIAAYGTLAPAVFILFQILQVIFAPFPGEASGFVGGYLFGTLNGFIFSSIGLTLGSIINFAIGKILGKPIVRKLIPQKHLDRFDSFVKPQTWVAVFFLFILPGFPKDYLCLFLGVTPLPMKAFIIMAALGRMPGTYMLSLQGAALFEQVYGILALTVIGCMAIVLLVYFYREKLFQWVGGIADE